MFQTLTGFLGKVSFGDDNAVKQSGMDNERLGVPKTPKLSKTSLLADHYMACTIKAAAQNLGMKTLEDLCQQQINLLGVQLHKFHNMLLEPRIVDVQDCAETMKDLVEELPGE